MDLGLVECLVKHQLVGKFPGKLREGDWGIIENIDAGVLKVSCGVGASLTLLLIRIGNHCWSGGVCSSVLV